MVFANNIFIFVFDFCLGTFSSLFKIVEAAWDRRAEPHMQEQKTSI